MSSLRKKIDRMKTHLGSENAPENPPPSANRESGEKTRADIPFLEQWEKENVHPYFFDGEYCLVREKRFPLDLKHGKYRFSQFIDAVSAWHRSESSHPLSAKVFSPEDLFFFDIETTGLGGGTGNTIFLLGQASIEGDSVVLKQHFLPRPGAEVPLYQSFLESINYSTLVTYNGKSFDWPLVKTKHTLIREHLPRLPSFGHFDLFHAAKRLWKHKLERLKLSVVEEEVLGIKREHDIPGFLAPMIYFDFVERQNPEGIIAVMKHNETDILSLITLYIHLTFQLLGIDHKQTAKEIFEVGRWYAYLGETGRAAEAFSHAAESGGAASIEAKLALSRQLKKQQKWLEAVRLWKEVADGQQNDAAFQACIELAKFYEHKEKNIQNAILYAKKAETLLNKEWKMNHSEKNGQLSEEVQKRIQRLNRKILTL